MPGTATACAVAVPGIIFKTIINALCETNEINATAFRNRNDIPSCTAMPVATRVRKRGKNRGNQAAKLAHWHNNDTTSYRYRRNSALSCNGKQLIYWGMLVRLAGIEPTTLGFGGSLDDYENWHILL